MPTIHRPCNNTHRAAVSVALAGSVANLARLAREALAKVSVACQGSDKPRAREHSGGVEVRRLPVAKLNGLGGGDSHHHGRQQGGACGSTAASHRNGDALSLRVKKRNCAQGGE